ncbi:hypothetical protein GUJ93_ZPchr0005g15914 [Zizania palustris]|uniref:Uncharacterized protein n=1 Tax=Zizania palustris TaxID=103762 RepID=A0A8J5W0Z6_ZIZPA|nr:hypothetical protein GUJ93_ZPchr0005g15914 [Zizania palustris]
MVLLRHPEEKNRDNRSSLVWAAKRKQGSSHHFRARVVVSLSLDHQTPQTRMTLMPTMMKMRHLEQSAFPELEGFPRWLAGAGGAARTPRAASSPPSYFSERGFAIEATKVSVSSD